MPIVLGVAAALWILLVLAVIGAVLVGALVASMLRHMLHGFNDTQEPRAWDPFPLDAADEDLTSDDLTEEEEEGEDWVPGDRSHCRPEDATAWWWSPEGSAPELVINTGRRPGASAVAEKPATAKMRIWTIHPDHTAHYQDDALDCPWCSSDPA
jgi:hypothetical protein